MRAQEGFDELAPWEQSLPDGWRGERVDNLAQVMFSNVDKKSFDHEEPVRLCNYVDVYKNDRITGSLEFMEATADEREIEKFQIRRGDVLATKDSETPDDIAIASLVAEELPGVLCGYHLAMMRPRSKELHGPYLAWNLASKQIRAQYEARATGVTRYGLPQYAFRAARIPLPPVGEQRLISEFLDASCNSIDGAIAAKRGQITTLDTLATNVIARAVTCGVDERLLGRADHALFGEVPGHWRQLHLKRVTSRIQAGTTPPTANPAYYDDGTIPWFAPGSFNGELSLVEPRKLINDLAVTDGVLRLFPAGSVFVVGIGATIGKVGLIDSVASCNQQILGIVPRAEVSSRFLAYQLKVFEAIIPRIAPATTLPIFDQVKTGYLPVLLPPAGEQEAICSHLDEKLADIKRTSAVLEKQITVLRTYRSSLIHECVTGQRRLTEADLRRVKAHG